MSKRSLATPPSSPKGYRVMLTDQAKRDFNELDKSGRTRVSRALRAMALNPRPAPPVSKQLKGGGEWERRWRAWPYRIFYSIDERGPEPRVVVGSIVRRNERTYD